MNRYVKGAIAGTLATVPMTIVMLSLHRRLPTTQRYALPPKQITREVANRVGAKEVAKGKHLTRATLVSHFSYGAATGALYPLLAERVRTRTRITGPAFGVAIWALSYLGWVPALRILPPATRHPMRRNLLMIAAHVVWGAALDFFTRPPRLRSR